MGRTPNTIELESLSVRYPPLVGNYLRGEVTRLMKAKGRQCSLNDVIREMIEAFRTMFGLPQPVVDVLEQERQKLKMDMQQYVSHLLFERYEQLTGHATTEVNFYEMRAAFRGGLLLVRYTDMLVDRGLLQADAPHLPHTPAVTVLADLLDS